MLSLSEIECATQLENTMKNPVTIRTSCAPLKRFALAMAASAALGIGPAGATAPVNDDYANAIELTGDSGTQTGTGNVDATFQSGEPICVYAETTNTVWFKWTCSTTGTWTIDTAGSSTGAGEWDACLAVYKGASLGSLVKVAQKDSGLAESLAVRVTAGTTYYLQAGGYAPPIPGDVATNIHLSWSFALPLPPVNVSGYITNANSEIGADSTANMTAATTFGWQTYGCGIPIINNGFLLTMDSGGGNYYNYTGDISGPGGLWIGAGGADILHIGGSDANTYGGSTVVNSGPVSLEKSYGNALCGNITVQGSPSGSFPGMGNVIWTAPDQISDTSNVSLASTASLNLDGFSDTINELHLVTGSYVQTGAGGVLKVAKLFINGTQQPDVAYIAGDGFVTGSGYIEVGASGPPVISEPPSTPANPAPASGLTTVHPAMLAKLDWDDSARAGTYDVYLWLASDPTPVPGTDPPTATVTLSDYTLPSNLTSLTAYKWQVVAKNAAGNTAGPVWTFSTVSRQDISNATTYAEANWPNGGVRINNIVGTGNTGRLVGTTQTHWTSGGFSVSLNLNGNTLIVDSGGGNPCSANGAIFGNGAVNVGAGGVGWIYFGGSTGNTYTGTSLLSSGPIGLGKSSGNSLCGTITVQGTMSGNFPGTGNLVWLASNQISDDSDVSVVTSGGVLNLAGFTDTINGLSLTAGSSVATGAGGVLTVKTLTVNGTVLPSGTYTSSSPFVTGSGSIEVLPSGSPFEIWASTHVDGQSASEDFDHDGVSNGLKYFMGTAGTIAGANPPVVTTDGVMTVTWPRDPAATVTSFKVQVSDNLAAWSDIIPPDSSIDTSDPTKVVYTLPTGASKKFCRLVVIP